SQSRALRPAASASLPSPPGKPLTAGFPGPIGSRRGARGGGGPPRGPYAGPHNRDPIVTGVRPRAAPPLREPEPFPRAMLGNGSVPYKQSSLRFGVEVRAVNESRKVASGEYRQRVERQRDARTKAVRNRQREPGWEVLRGRRAEIEVARDVGRSRHDRGDHASRRECSEERFPVRSARLTRWFGRAVEAAIGTDHLVNDRASRSRSC